MSDLKAKINKIRFPPRPRWGSLQRSPDPLAVFKGKLKTAAPFLFAHPVNRLYSFVQLSMVREFIGVWKNMLFYWLHCKIASPLWFVPYTSIHQVSSPDLGPSAVPYHLAGAYRQCSYMYKVWWAINNHIQKGLILSLSVKNVLKSINIWQSYKQEGDCLRFKPCTWLLCTLSSLCMYCMFTSMSNYKMPSPRVFESNVSKVGKLLMFL